MKQVKYSIIDLAGKYVSNLLTEQLPHDLSFHNLPHTINVVRGVREISNYLQLVKEAQEILILAAWFHDCGHIVTYRGHEAESQKLAKDFLEGEDYPNEKIAEVLSCIGATRMPQQPVGLMQKIICDADLYHLSLPEYPDLQHLLCEEWNRVLNKKYSDEEWAKANYNFLRNHKYWTTYGQEVLQKRKLTNEHWCYQMIEPFESTSGS